MEITLPKLKIKLKISTKRDCPRAQREVHYRLNSWRAMCVVPSCQLVLSKSPPYHGGSRNEVAGIDGAENNPLPLSKRQQVELRYEPSEA